MCYLLPACVAKAYTKGAVLSETPVANCLPRTIFCSCFPN